MSYSPVQTTSSKSFKQYLFDPYQPVSRTWKPTSPGAPLHTLVSALGTWSFNDKAFMFIQYTATVIAYLLKQSRLKEAQDVGARAAKLASLLSDSRILYRSFGSMNIIKWILDLEFPPRNPTIVPRNRLHLWAERIQALSFLFYYPLEHMWFFADKGILPISKKRADKCLLYACRLWAVYVVIQIARAISDLRDAKKFLAEANRPDRFDPDLQTAAKEKIRHMWNEIPLNLTYLPLTIHWSLPNGAFPSDREPLITGLLGMIVSTLGLKEYWRLQLLNSR